MSDLKRRLEKLEQATGNGNGNGEGCPACRGRDVVQFWIDDTRTPPISTEPKPGPIPCARCGRDMLNLTVVRIVDGPIAGLD